MRAARRGARRTIGSLGLALAALLALGAGEASAQLALPAAKITSGPSGEVPSRTATFTFSGAERAPFATSSCRLDGGPWVGCRSPQSYKDLVGGAHRFEVRLEGALVDRTPDVRDWTVAVNTESIDACPSGSSCANPAPYDRRRSRRKRVRRRDVAGCAYGGNRLQSGEKGRRRYGAATACLIGVQRSRARIPPLGYNPRLAAAARRHVKDMIKRRYFAHVSPTGSSPADRIGATGYLAGARYWAVGEILAYGTDRMTPAQLVQAWMRSPAHRRVILTAALTRIGVHISRGTPRSRRRGVTAAAEFGRVSGA